MGLVLVLLVGVYLAKTAAVDTAAMATGRTPPSHAYRMAKMQADAELQKQALSDPARAAAAKTSAPDLRGGAKMVARHWYLDACEDVDEWRAARRLSRPQRKARKAQRKARRQAAIDGVSAKLGARWGQRLGPVGRLLGAWSDRRARRASAATEPPNEERSPGAEVTDTSGAGASAEADQKQDTPTAPQEGDPQKPLPGRQPLPGRPPPVPEQVPNLDRQGGIPVEKLDQLYRSKDEVLDLSAKRVEKARTEKARTEQSNPNRTGASMAENNTSAPDTASDAGGLNPHVAALNGAAAYLKQLNTMLERVQAQMTQADMGSEVTGALGTARDANTSAAAAMQAAAAKTEQVNRKVQEAYNASQGQAANKDYQQQGQ